MSVGKFISEILWNHKSGWGGHFTYSCGHYKDEMNNKFDLNYNYWIFIEVCNISEWKNLLDSEKHTEEELRYYMKEVINHLSKKYNFTDEFEIVFNYGNSKYLM